MEVNRKIYTTVLSVFNFMTCLTNNNAIPWFIAQYVYMIYCALFRGYTFNTYKIRDISSDWN